MKNNKCIQFMLVFVSILLLVGCWDIKDIDQRTLPLVMGISKESENQYQVSLQIPISKVDEKQVSRVETGEGESIASALEQIRINTENGVDHSHIRLIVIHEDLASNIQDFKRMIKFLMEWTEISSSVLVAITDENMINLLSTINKQLGVDATSVYDFFNKGVGWAPEISVVKVWDLYRSLSSYTRDIGIPIIHSGEDTVLKFIGTSIVKKGEITGKINVNETQLYNLFHHRKASGRREDLKFASVKVLNSSLRNKPLLKSNQPFIYSDLKVKITILDRKEGITEEQIKKKLENLIENRFYKMFEQAQKEQTDIFGFGQYFRNQISYHELKDWRTNYYPDLKVKFKVHVSFQNNGFTEK